MRPLQRTMVTSPTPRVFSESGTVLLAAPERRVHKSRHYTEQHLYVSEGIDSLRCISSGCKSDIIVCVCGSSFMTQDQALRTVADALRSPTVVEFVKASVKAGYREFFGAANDEVCGMVDSAFDEALATASRTESTPGNLVEVTSALLDDTFRKSDPSFWFNRIYHQYKTQAKPETDFQRLQSLLPGKRVLDYGCGSGYLAARLAKADTQVFTADVLDYRYPEARHLPFVQMASPTDIAIPR